MTSFKTAKEKGIPWPQGPDDLCPSKIENTYLYGGGRTRKLKFLLGGICGSWFFGTMALDRYLYNNRANRAQNYVLQRVCTYSVRYMFPVFFLLGVGIPLSQAMYWKALKLSVGVESFDRNPKPNWKPGEGLLDKDN